MKRIFFITLLTTMLLLSASSAWAIFTFGEKDQLSLSGKIESRVTFNTEDHRGYTTPRLSSWEMIQHRNLAYLELQHRVSPIFSYRAVGRGLYEGIYDYGPDEFQDLADENKDAIEDLWKEVELWEGYADFTPGKSFFRVGKQIISWGETDLFPMLDRINPLDNTFGGAFEDLEDRRLPLWMAKGLYNFGNIGPVQSLALEGFINPGSLYDNNFVAPVSPAGTPYAFPLPASPIPVVVTKPEKEMDSSRYGARLQGMLANNYNWSVAHYVTYNDQPSAILAFDDNGAPIQELLYPQQKITGGSVSFFNEPTQMIYRVELAYHWDEPVFIPEINLSGTGEIPEKDIFRFAVAADKNFWIRSLNRTSMFNFTLQYFGERITDFDDRIRLPALDYPSGAFTTVKKYEQKYVFLCYTNYWNGKINPQVAGAYDPRGAWLILPEVTLLLEPWRFNLQYSFVDGRDDISFGFLRDRDQVSFTVSLLF